MKEDGAVGLFRGAGPTVVRAMALNMGMLASNDEVSLTMCSSSGRLCIQYRTCRWAGDGLGTGIILLLHDATGDHQHGACRGLECTVCLHLCAACMRRRLAALL